jgi:hypothetical protein
MEKLLAAAREIYAPEKPKKSGKTAAAVEASV